MGTAELLLSDSQRFATAATQAGATVSLIVGHGLTHFYPYHLGTPEAAHATTQIAELLRQHVRVG